MNKEIARLLNEANRHGVADPNLADVIRDNPNPIERYFSVFSFVSLLNNERYHSLSTILCWRKYRILHIYNNAIT